MQFRDPMVKPGEATVLQLKASPRSLCAVGVVDKSVHLLKKSNQLDPAKVHAFLCHGFMKWYIAFAFYATPCMFQIFPCILYYMYKPRLYCTTCLELKLLDSFSAPSFKFC